MNKQELIDAAAAGCGLSKKDLETALGAFLSAIAEELQEGGKVTLVGFGSFEVVDRAARHGHNPKTGEALEIPASRKVKFSAGKALKDSVQ